MILPTGKPATNADPSRSASAFTLIELILVMAILTIAASVIYPSLSGHFRGRVLDSEARRMLALTRYAQSRAISEGIPMVLWLDTQQSSYGLESDPGYTEEEARPLEFQLDRDLVLEAAPENGVLNPMVSTVGEATGTVLEGTSAERPKSGLREIRFYPDGMIGRNSPIYLKLSQRDKDKDQDRGREAQSLWLVEHTNRHEYAIRTTLPSQLSR
jgi:type II secretion system protein H